MYRETWQELGTQLQSGSEQNLSESAPSEQVARFNRSA
jgi:hypothetical protein